MSIEVSCECGNAFSVPDYLENRPTSCPKCKRIFWAKPLRSTSPSPDATPAASGWSPAWHDRWEKISWIAVIGGIVTFLTIGCIFFGGPGSRRTAEDLQKAEDRRRQQEAMERFKKNQAEKQADELQMQKRHQQEIADMKKEISSLEGRRLALTRDLEGSQTKGFSTRPKEDLEAELRTVDGRLLLLKQELRSKRVAVE